MAKLNQLTNAPPFAVEQAIRRLGENLRTARLRRNLTIEEVAETIGTGRRAVADAEHGKVTSGVVNYVALLWAYGLLDDLEEVGDPLQDAEGLSLLDGRVRARPTGDLDDDF